LNSYIILEALGYPPKLAFLIRLLGNDDMNGHKLLLGGIIDTIIPRMRSFSSLISWLAE
jgi:hypothetical protein